MPLGIKFRGHTKEEAKQQPAIWMNFITRQKKYAKNCTSFLPSHIRKPAAGFSALNKAYYITLLYYMTDTELKHLDWFQGFSQDTYLKMIR